MACTQGAPRDKAHNRGLTQHLSNDLPTAELFVKGLVAPSMLNICIQFQQAPYLHRSPSEFNTLWSRDHMHLSRGLRNSFR